MLLLGSACGLLGTSSGCHDKPPPARGGPHPLPARAEPAALPARADAAAPVAGESPANSPLLRTDRPLVTSGDAFAAFPCAEPELSDARYEALNLQGDEVRDRVVREHWERELAFRARNMALSRDVDSLEIMRAALSQGVRFWDHRLPIHEAPLARAGAACARAADAAHCKQELARQREALFARLMCRQEECPEFDFTYAQTTRGDEVRTYRSEAELRALLGPIDTPHEGWLWLNVRKLTYDFACDRPEYAQHRKTHAGFELVARSVTSRCHPFTEKAFTYRVRGDGKVELLATRVVSNDPERCVVSGRRPAQLAPYRGAARGDAGQLFAHMAYLEAASVFAFVQLERDLNALGAPAALLRRVRRARRDEQRHAAQMAALARRHGGVVEPPRVVAQPPRAALEVALENAGEGCVRELFGALLARFQAERAEAAEVRGVLARIADDEAAHAALSWRLASWLEPRLSEAERARVQRARAAALSTLASELFEPSPAQRAQCGMPSLRESEGLWRSLMSLVRGNLWGDAVRAADQC